MWAVRQMRKGMKVRRSFWEDTNYFQMNEQGADYIVMSYCKEAYEELEFANFHLEYFMAKDWVIFKEKKPLSAKAKELLGDDLI